MTGPRHRWQFNWQQLDQARLLHAPTGLAADRACALTGDTAPLLAKHGPHNTPRILGRLRSEARACWTVLDQGRPITHARLPERDIACTTCGFLQPREAVRQLRYPQDCPRCRKRGEFDPKAT